MEPLSNVDRLVLLLRQRLEERTRAAGRPKAPAKAGRSASPLAQVHALAAVDGVDDRQLKRALIQSLLTEQFGAELINDAKFQRVVDKVTETIDGEEASAKLLSRIVRELRAAA